MKAPRSVRVRLALQNTFFVLLLVALAALVVQLGRVYRAEWDLTASGRNSLSAASLEVVRKLEGPVRVTAFATEQDPRLGDLRKLIRDFLAPYQRAKSDLSLAFVDPREQPKAADQAGVQVNGELLVEHAGRSERLAHLSELEFTNLLIRLARADERLVMWLEGHGERSLAQQANHDLGDFGKQLRQKGIGLNALNLGIAPEVPENAALLVVAGPRVEVPAAEVEKIARYVERGGNLLWLIDQEPLYGLEPIAERLGLVLSPGVVVDPDAIERGGRPLMSVGAAYGAHPIVRSFRLNTLFPFARAIGTIPLEDWSATPLIEVAPRGWIESGDLNGRIVFDEGADTPGPVVIAVALERQREERMQRVVAVGSGHFLANTYLGNGGNLDLGINMVNWLTGDDRLIAVQPRHAADASLSLSRGWLTTLVVVFLIALPLAFLAAGALIWWRRRNA
jgi:ABC-type uncharacterized transport system involved in gliding motility auxiliary subunit